MQHSDKLACSPRNFLQTMSILKGMFFFFSRVELSLLGIFDDVRKLSHENLISQLLNSDDYYVNLRLIMFISSCFEIRDKLI